MTDLNNLLARVEKASGPSRELDALICVALFPDELSTDTHNAAHGSLWSAKHGPVDADHLTSSVDAALALVERALPGWGCRLTLALGCGATAEVFAEDGRAYDVNGDANIDLSDWLHQGKIHRATPALAILSSLLHALKEKTNG